MVFSQWLDSTAAHDVKSRRWALAAVLVASAPALHTIATWDLDGRLTSQGYAVRHYSVVVTLIELLVVWLAVRAGLSVKSAILALPKSIIFLLGIWLSFALIALFSRPDGLANAAIILMRYMVHGLFLAALIHLAATSSDFKLHRWLSILTLGAVAYVALLAIFCIMIPDPANFPWVKRLPSGTNIRHISNIIGLLAIAPITLLLTSGKSIRWRYIVALIIIIAFTAWTGSRATLLGLVFGVAAGLFIIRQATAIKNVVITGSAAIVGVAASLLIPAPNSYFGVIRMFMASSKQDDPSTGRWQLWANTCAQISESKWLGHGAGRFRNDMDALYGTQLNHPHNLILQYIYDWGVLGGGAGLLLIAIIGLTIWRTRDADPGVRFTALAAFAAICTTAMIDSPLFNPLPIVIALALIAPVFVPRQHVPAV